jgi:hypothetical protein
MLRLPHTCYMSRPSRMRLSIACLYGGNQENERQNRREQQNATRWRAPFGVSLASGATQAGCHVNPVRSSFVRETEKERGDEKSFPLQGKVLKKVRLYATNRNEDIQEKVYHDSEKNQLLDFDCFTRHQPPFSPSTNYCLLDVYVCMCSLLASERLDGFVFIFCIREFNPS